MKYIKLFEFFDSSKLLDWFGNSKVVDDNDNPLIVYHGSPIKFTDFELSKDLRLYGALFFTDNIKIAKTYGNYVYKAYLKIENPHYYDACDQTFNEVGDTVDMLAFRLGGGDGVIVKNIKDAKSGKDKRYKSSQIFIVRDLEQILKVN